MRAMGAMPYWHKHPHSLASALGTRFSQGRPALHYGAPPPGLAGNRHALAGIVALTALVENLIEIFAASPERASKSGGNRPVSLEA